MAWFASRRWLAAVVTLASLAKAAGARADLPCPVALTPSSEPEWQAALRGAQATSHPGAPADCRSIHLAVLPDKTAELEFVTTDGRVATRHLEGPAELASAIQALLVTVAPPAAPTASPSPAAPPPAAPPPAAPPPAAPPPA